MMDAAHKKCMSSLASLAAAKSTTIPTTATNDALSAYKTLNEKSGADFDLLNRKKNYWGIFKG